MNIEFKFLESKGIVVCKVIGGYDFSKKADFILELASEMKKHKSKKCVVDFSNADVIMNTIIFYERPQLFKEIGFDNMAKGAIVFKTLTKECLFYEDVCQNRGWNMRVFSTFNEALQWLSK